jgi:thiopeptide-type bacteriocin biosynthesis protein
LAEFLFDDNEAIVKDADGGVFTNEFVAVFTVATTSVADFSATKVAATGDATDRSFSIGSEWLYFKIYCGAATADELLCNTIYPLVQQFLENDWISDWFFIRYNDPKNHIRIRFRLKNQENVGYLITFLYDSLKNAIAQKQIWKLQTDTYEREIERYGVATMELSEQLFCLDSMMTLNFLSQIDSFQSDYRWLFGIIAIDALLDAFGYDLEQKTKLLEGMKTSFGKEFGMNKHLRKQMNEKYEKFESQIKIFFQEEIEDENLAFVRAYALQNQVALKAIALNISTALTAPQLQDVLGSYIHMTMNRLFKSKQRMYEMLVYDFSYKNYKTMAYVTVK